MEDVTKDPKTPDSAGRHLPTGKSSDMEKDLIKPSGTIHITRRVGLMAQKTWNLFLYNAGNDLNKAIHTIPLSMVRSYFRTNNQDKIQDVLKELMTTIVEFNIFGKDKKKWEASTLLSSAAIVNGQVEYSFSPHLLSHLQSREMYAKISMRTQHSLKSKHSISLFEFCIDYVGIGKTPFITINDICRYLNVSAVHVEGDKKGQPIKGSVIIDKFVKPAIKEINEKSKEIYIGAPVTKKAGRSIVAICLPVESLNKTKPSTDVDANPLLIAKLVSEFGAKPNAAMRVVGRYPEAFIMDSMFYVRDQASRNPIRNKWAYLLDALDKNYAKSKNAPPEGAVNP